MLALGSVTLIAAAACGGSSAPAQPVTFDVNVVGNKMMPTDKLQAHTGDMVTLNLTADKAEEIHLHGYDYHFDMQAGQKMTKTFTADKEGSFEIELEATSTHLGEMDITPR
jgi:FtsP/CotA-like multicopper oxidase with cupredoxin domain